MCFNAEMCGYISLDSTFCSKGTLDSLSKLNIKVGYILVLTAEVKMPIDNNNLLNWSWVLALVDCKHVERNQWVMHL